MKRLITFWLGSMVLVGTLASAVTAQVVKTTPRIVTAADLGFRVEGKDPNGRPVGSLVLRINGEWVPVSSAVQPSPLTMR
jgi:hypothetical protein